MKTLTNLFILLAFAINTTAQPIEFDDEFWYNRGPECAFGNSIAISPSNTQILYLGTYADGIYKSINGGDSWFQCATANLPRKPDSLINLDPTELWYGNIEPVNAIAVHPQNPNEVLVAMRNSVLIRSRDGGNSWAFVNYFWQKSFSTSEISYNPDFPDNIVVGGYANSNEPLIYYSSDGGNDWNWSNNIPNSFKSISDLQRNPINSNHLIISVTDGYSWSLYESFNNGKDWHLLHDAHDIFYFVFNPFDSLKLWGIVVDPWNQLLLHSSQDGGATWEFYDDLPYEPYQNVWSLFMDWNANLYIEKKIIGGSGYKAIFRTEDEGDSWTRVNSLDSMYNAFPFGALSLHNSCVSNKYNPNEMFFSNRHGVFFSNDGGETTQLKNTGLQDTYIFDVEVHPEKTNIAIATGQQGLWKTKNNGLSWEQISSHRYGQVIYNPKYPDTVYASSIALMRSYDGGNSFTKINYFGGSINDIAIHPDSTNIIFVHISPDTYAHGIFKSKDYGDTWRLVFSSDAPERSNGIHINPLNPNIIYFSEHKSLDCGETWEHCFDYHIIDIKPDDPNVLYATNLDINKLYKSDDQGQTFELIHDTGLEIFNFKINLVNPNYIFYITKYSNVFYNNKIYYSDDGGDSWYNFHGPFINQVSEIVPLLEENKFYISTYGDGVWVYNTDTTSTIKEIFNQPYCQIKAQPNPFSNSVYIDIHTKKSYKVNIMIYNFDGIEIRHFKDKLLQSGVNRIYWDGKNDINEDVSNGIYFFTIKSNLFRKSHKLLKIN